MARLAFALDPATEDRLLADVVEHGHVIVARLVTWSDMLESLDVLAPDVVLVGAGRATLSDELLAACDERGIRLVALASSDSERANAAQVGLHEVVERFACTPYATSIALAIERNLPNAFARPIRQATETEGALLARVRGAFLFLAAFAAGAAVLGVFVPSGGSKWVIEAPYVMAAAHELKVHLGWVVAAYDLGEALANLVQPFWMLPILGLFQLRARDVMGYTFVVFLALVPVVLLIVTILGATLSYPL